MTDEGCNHDHHHDDGDDDSSTSDPDNKTFSSRLGGKKSE